MGPNLGLIQVNLPLYSTESSRLKNAFGWMFNLTSTFLSFAEHYKQYRS